MKSKEYTAMISLSALWGASFLFMKISSAEMGPFLTANLRVLIAAMVLMVVCFFYKHKLDFFENWRKYFILGALNAAIPFALICTAEIHIDASLAAILNASTPIFTAIAAALWHKEKFSLRKILGLAFGFSGVIILVGWNGINNNTIWIYASLSVLASVSLGTAAVYASIAFENIKPLNLASGQLLSASIMLFPFSMFNLPERMPGSGAVLSVVLLAVFCSAVVSLLYFYLIKHVGAVKTLAVTFLVPVFGIIWSRIFLNEIISIQNVIGLLIITVSIIFIERG
jgi:drug/metabolite transporter (DMT)-like permease